MFVFVCLFVCLFLLAVISTKIPVNESSFPCKLKLKEKQNKTDKQTKTWPKFHHQVMWHRQSRSATSPVWKRHRAVVSKAHVSEPILAVSIGLNSFKQKHVTGHPQQPQAKQHKNSWNKNFMYTIRLLKLFIFKNVSLAFWSICQSKCG